MPILQTCKNNDLFSKGLTPLSDDKILDRSKLKQIAEDNLKCILNEKYVPCKVGNIVRKEEPFLEMFSTAIYLYIVCQNVALYGHGLTTLII